MIERKDSITQKVRNLQVGYKQMLWAEKYRPRLLKDIINQQEIKIA